MRDFDFIDRKLVLAIADENYFRTCRRKSPTVSFGIKGQPAEIAAVKVDRINLALPVAVAGKDDLLVVGRERGDGIEGFAVCKISSFSCLGVINKNIEAVTRNFSVIHSFADKSAE